MGRINPIWFLCHGVVDQRYSQAWRNQESLRGQTLRCRKIYDGNIDVGASNTKWVLEYLRAEGLSACKTDLGDMYPRKVYYFTESGRVLLKKLERLKNRTIEIREQEYAAKIQTREQAAENEVTLF